MTQVAFTRTPPGLSNQAAFLGVDLVVFTESGNRTLTIEEVEQGLENGETPDAVFWRAVLGMFCPPQHTFHIKTVGSKTTVRAIATMVATESVVKIATAMDRDLDSYNGTLIAHSNVIYTRGYSWENDVWTPEAAAAIFGKMNPDSKKRLEAEREITSFFNQIEKCFGSAVRLDRSLAANNALPLSRESLEDIVRPSPPADPSLLRHDMAALLIAARKQHVRIKRHPDSGNLMSDLHGHTLAKAMTSMLRNLIQNLTGHKLSHSLLTSMAITEFVRNDNPALTHYSVPVQNILWA